MSSKNKQNRLDGMRDAALGYTTIVLAAVCFLIALAVVVVAVRFVVGLGASANTATTAGTTTVTTIGRRA